MPDTKGADFVRCGGDVVVKTIQVQISVGFLIFLSLIVKLVGSWRTDSSTCIKLSKNDCILHFMKGNRGKNQNQKW